MAGCTDDCYPNNILARASLLTSVCSPLPKSLIVTVPFESSFSQIIRAY
jgi:hypothetical protein